MMLFEPMRDAFRALRINILRSVLTTLGIIIGVGAVIVMVSIGAGAQAQVEDIISSMGADVLYVFPGSTLGRARMGTGSLPTLTEDDAEAIPKRNSGNPGCSALYSRLATDHLRQPELAYPHNGSTP